MQDRYAGDIGDYVKLALLRSLSEEKKLGIAWYLFPDEGHNDDGRHIDYLSNPDRWRDLDPELYDGLKSIINASRSIASLERLEALSGTFSREPLIAPNGFRERSAWRSQWFDRLLSDLESSQMVFADPDNGLIDNASTRRSRRVFGKQLPLAEAQALANGRTAIIYHHNTRRKGGHNAEVDHWLKEISLPAMAVRATAYSCRTFFIINPDVTTQQRVEAFCKRWANHSVRLHPRNTLHGAELT